MRGRQQRAWTWSVGCDGDDKRGGVRSAASLLKRRETGEEGGGPVWGGAGARWRSRGGSGTRQRPCVAEASAGRAMRE
jgi:hypothetical protein